MAGVEPESKQEEDSSETMIRLFNDFYKAVELGRLEEFMAVIESLQPFLESPDTKVTEVLRNKENPFNDTNLIILCCKFGQLNILDYLLNNGKTFIDSLYNGTIANVLSPLDEDGEGHNAFYYAIRSNKKEIVQLLLTKWLRSYDESVSYKDSLLSTAYEKLKLRNVELTEGMEFFVESELVACRFISNGDDGHARDLTKDLLKRMDWLLTNIDCLKTVGGESKFLLLAKCVAQNIHILKYQLKATYEMIPWEELEFCVVSYIISRNPQEKSIIPVIAITQETLLKQLGFFAEILKNLSFQRLRGPNVFLNMSRKEVVSNIKKNSPEFIELYEIYEEVRHIYSLEKLEGYLKSSLSVNHEEKQGQLAILRVLQVLGDYLKNTLDNYKLSEATSRIILSALPRNIRNILIELRNTVSHTHSLKKRLEIEENPPEFFRDVQHNLKLLSRIVSGILSKKKLRIAENLIDKIYNSESNNAEEVRKLGKSIRLVHKCMDSESVKLFDELKILRLVGELKTAISAAGMSDRELQFFDDVIKSSTLKRHFNTPLTLLVVPANKALQRGAIDQFEYIKLFLRKLDSGCMVRIKRAAHAALCGLCATNYAKEISKVLEFCKEIDKTIKRKYNLFNFLKLDVEKINMLLFEISFTAADKVEDVPCLDTTLHKFIPDSIESPNLFLSETERSKILKSKLGILKNLIGNEVKSGDILKGNDTLRLATELLLLDMLSNSDVAKCYSDNTVLHVEDHTPVLIGECLKNYLAHGSALLDIFPTDPAKAIQSNAMLFINGENSTDGPKIRKEFSDEVSKGKQKFKKNIVIVANQDQLFLALENGDMETSLALIKCGADLFGRSIDNEWTLHFAARSPNFDKGLARLILERNVDVNSTDKEGKTALHVGASLGKMGFLNHLVNAANVDLEQKDKNGQTCLHSAAKHGRPKTVALLIKLGANMSPKDENSRTPLFSAIENNCVSVVETLLDHGANKGGCEVTNGPSPLHLAAEYNRVSIIELLLRKGAHVNVQSDQNGTPLIVAAASESADAVDVLLKAGANVNAYFAGSFTALHYAADNALPTMTAALLKNGADAHTKNYDLPIHFAARNGESMIFEGLIQHKANLIGLNSWGLAPLHVAAQCGNESVIETLLEAGVDIESTDKQGSTALHLSASNGQLEATKLLIEKGAKLDAMDRSGSTALHLSAEGGFDKVGIILVNKGAKVDVARRVDGCTPLHIATKKRANSLVKLLLRQGANPQAKNRSGMTPVHLASAYGNTDGVVLLLTVSKNRPNVNIRNIQGKTPLHLAATAGSCEIAELLLKKQADANSTCGEGLTPLYYAVAHEHSYMVQLLVRHGADINIGVVIPVVKAIENNSKDILEYLVKKGADVSKDDLLFKTVCSGVPDCMLVLLKNGCSADSRSGGDQTPLHLASAMGFKNIVSYLLAYGANVNSLDHDKMTPLHYAVKANNPEVVEVLLSSDANFGSKTRNGQTALHFAAEFGDGRIIEILLAKGADPLEEDENRETALSQSIRSCDVEKVKAMCQSQKVNQSVLFWNRISPYQLSAAYSLDIVKYFVTIGCVPNLLFADPKPIHMASITGKQDIVEYFLDSGVSVNETCRGKQTPLHYAALHDHHHLVEYLVSKGANVNAEDKQSNTPLALGRNNDVIVKFLLKNGAFLDEGLLDDVAKSYLDVLELLDDIDHVSVIKKHIQMGTCINAVSLTRGSPLHHASSRGCYESVKLLIDHNANVNVLDSNGCTPLHYAAKSGKIDIVLELLMNGAVYNALDAKGNTPLHLATNIPIETILSTIEKYFDAIEKGDVTVETTILWDLCAHSGLWLEAFIKTRNRNNQDIFEVVNSFDYPEQNDLYELCHTSYIEVNSQRLNCRDLCEATIEKMRAEFKKKQEWFAGKNTPFSQKFCQEMNNLLLELDKYENTKNSAKQENLDTPPEKQTEVIAAALKGDMDSLKELLRNKYDVNETDSDRITALHVAVDRGDEICVKLLLQFGADVSHISQKGDTALHTAVYKQSAPIVRMLLEFALNNGILEELVNKPTSSGNTALHIAAKIGDMIIVKMLLTYGAIFESKNGENETPKDLSLDDEVIKLFNLLSDMFADARTGNFRLVTLIKSMKKEDVCAVAGAKNIGGRTILQVASSLKHKSIPNTLMKIVQTANVK